nr:hypothetical protein Iba_chr14aCG27150 [Ipomoea batatas]
MTGNLSSLMGKEEFFFLGPFITQEALLRCGRALYRRLKMEAWMLLIPMCSGTSMNLHLAIMILRGEMI